MCPQKKLHNYCFNEHFTTGNYREGEDEREEKSQLAARASHNYNRINYYIRPHQDANWFFLYRVLPPLRVRLNLIIFTAIFLEN